jgi:N-acetylglutamate synthase-like GNAT family acetyltransferase
MQHVYFSKEDGVVIHGMDIGDCWLITSIGVQSAQRGRGAATRMLQEVLKDADKDQVKLFLSIEPDGTGLDDDALRSWYSRLGFVSMDPTISPIGMERLPKI